MQGYGADERRYAEAAAWPELTLARVISQHKDLYNIITESGELLATLSGRLRHEARSSAEYPAVGDFVMVEPADKESAVIHAVLARRTVFERPSAGNRSELQVIAANIDIVFICMALDANYSLNRLERYLAAAWTGGAKPVVLLTKSDLCGCLSEVTRSTQAAALGARVIVVSKLEERSCERVRSLIPSGVTASFIGSSGVGKSTLINALLGSDALATGEIRGSDGRGRHTTTSRELLLLPSGGVVIDTPGMRELGAQASELERTFSDIDALAARCRFADCTHQSEPGCAVREALESGALDERRLQNYLKLKKESRYEGQSSREIESAKIGDMFGSKSAMKKTRDFYKNKK